MAEAKTVPNKAYYVTYGTGTNRKNKYSIVYAESYMDARMKVLQICGDNFAFLFNEYEWNGLFAGQTFGQKFGLEEIDLGPHRIER